MPPGQVPPAGAPRPPTGGVPRPPDPRVEVTQPGRDPRTGRPLTTPPPVRPPASQQRQPLDIPTRLDAQRGWLNELDRSLKKRSIIALVLTCLAVGVGAAALYISLTKNADGDRITALETRISALEAATGGGAAATGTTEGVPSTGVTPSDAGTVSPDTGTVIPDTGTVPPASTGGTTVPGTTPGE